MTEQTQAVPVSFEYRNTGMGGHDDVILMSFRTGKVIKSNLHTSASGSHGERTYFLLPGKYLFWKIRVSNSGNVHVCVGILSVDSDGKHEEQYVIPLYDYKSPTGNHLKLSKKWLELIKNNRNFLPFYELIFGDES